MKSTAFVFALLSFPAIVCQTSSIGNNNQNVGTNRGILIQNNISVTDTTRKQLKRRAKEDTGDEQGWLGILTPGNDPTPVSSCPSISKSALKVFLGKFEGACDGGLCSILEDRSTTANSKNLLSVQSVGRSLIISGVVFSEDGKVVVVLDKNRPHINKNNAFSWSRPDSHTIDVIDQRNRKVLHVRFMNKKTVYVEGLFYTESGRRLEIDSDVIETMGRNRFIGGCASNSGSVFAF